MAERIITVEPGLWEYTHSLEIPGLLGPVATPKTECIAPEDAQRSLDDLFEELSDGTGCVVSNLKDTLNTVEFDLNCKPALESIVLQSTGHLVFRYGRTKITGLATWRNLDKRSRDDRCSQWLGTSHWQMQEVTS